MNAQLILTMVVRAETSGRHNFYHLRRVSFKLINFEGIGVEGLMGLQKNQFANNFWNASPSGGISCASNSSENI